MLLRRRRFSSLGSSPLWGEVPSEARRRGVLPRRCKTLVSTLASLHRSARRCLSEAGIEPADLDARLLVEHFPGPPRPAAIARPDMAVSPEPTAAIAPAAFRRIAGEPVHRIIGYREFYGLKLRLSPETLEPRPDTETLVEAALPFVQEIARRLGACRIVDLGTGTGAIALALLSVVPEATAIGVDISQDALATAARNADDNGLSPRFRAVHSDWLDKISGKHHVIVANPPYIPSNDIGGLQKEVRLHDPIRALDGGEDGLDAYRIIAAQAAAHLEDGGVVAVEIGSIQLGDVTEIFRAAGYPLLASHRDLGGNDRTLVFGSR